MKKSLALLFLIAFFSNLAFSISGSEANAHGKGGFKGGSTPPPAGSPAPNGSASNGSSTKNSSPPPPPSPPHTKKPSMPSKPSGGAGGHGGSGSSSSQSQIINYRGERKLCSSDPLEIIETAIDKKNNTVRLNILFNQAVDSAKICNDSVFFNGEKVDTNVIIKFNRKSDSVTIIWPLAFYSEEEIQKSSVKLVNVQTFDGKIIEELNVK